MGSNEQKKRIDPETAAQENETICFSNTRLKEKTSGARLEKGAAQETDSVGNDCG